MSKFLITIEEVVEDKGIVAKILLWVFLLWWLYLLYFVVIFPLFILPGKLISDGFSDEQPVKVIIGFAIYAAIIIIAIVSLTTTAPSEDKLEFEGLEDSISITYGESFDYLNGIKLIKNGEAIDGTITYEGNVNSFALGDYIITYTGVFENETITKEIKITVKPYYSDYYVKVLQNFIVTKTGENEYTVSGVIINNTGRNLSKLTVNYYCVELDTTYNINFGSGMPSGEQSFSIILNSTYPLDNYNFKIDKITCY